MKRLSIVVWLIIGITISQAQVPVMELKPIQKQGWRYYYDLKPIETPYALQIPLTAMNDEEINRNYNTFKTLKKVGNLLWIAPVAILVNPEIPPESFALVVIGTAASNLILTILAHRKMKRAISRYNLLILEKSS